MWIRDKGGRRMQPIGQTAAALMDGLRAFAIGALLLVTLSACGGTGRSPDIVDVCRQGGCVCVSNFSENHPAKYWPVEYTRDGTPKCQHAYWLQVDDMYRFCQTQACYCQKPGVHPGRAVTAPVRYDSASRPICPRDMILRPAERRYDP